jgi:hypothetical protein
MYISKIHELPKLNKEDTSNLNRYVMITENKTVTITKPFNKENQRTKQIYC